MGLLKIDRIKNKWVYGKLIEFKRNGFIENRKLIELKRNGFIENNRKLIELKRNGFIEN